jgi:hypothetical protein
MVEYPALRNRKLLVEDVTYPPIPALKLLFTVAWRSRENNPVESE